MFSIESVKLWFKTRRKNTANQQNRNDVIYNKPLNDISSNLKTACPKIITDEPSLNYDAFDFKTYSEKLVHIILNSKPRFAIGIFGGWGTGKTTLMKMIEAKLNGYVFCWENIPTSEKDNHNLKKYIKKNFSNVDWIEQKEFIKSPDNKKISIYNNKDSISISLNENTNTVSLTINNEILNKELIVKKENNRSNIYEKQNDILTVWFDAWKYEKEKHLAILPFIRTIQIELEHKLANESTATNDYTITQLHKKWAKVRKGLEKTFNAFLESTNLNFELGKFVSTDTKLSTFKDVLKSESSPFEIDGERIFYYHKHISEHLIDAINNLRNTKLGGNPNNRIVVFIDDLDRCSPDKAIEVLESLKTFFDIEGFVYVIGMDSKSINAIVRKKYGNDSHIEGLEYMEKIVQLPFRIPTWKRGWTEEAISKSIIQIVSTELNDSELISEFDKNKELIAKAIQSNPRQLKRFINNVIFTKTVFNDRDIDKLIVVQALDFHQEWSNFLDLITPNQKRKAFFEHYIKLKAEGKYIYSKEDLNTFAKELSERENVWFRDILEIYQELINHEDNNDLRQFLDSTGADQKLLSIDKMEEYRVALDTTKSVGIQKSNDFSPNVFTDPLGSGSDWIYHFLLPWRDKFKKEEILSYNEIYSFRIEFNRSITIWLDILKKSRLFDQFKRTSELSQEVISQLYELEKISVSEEKNSILNMQKKIGETLDKIDNQIPV